MKHTPDKSAIHGQGLFARMQITCPGQVISGEDETLDLIGWVNHSCRPSAVLDHAMRLVALTPLEIGDEITLDYRDTLDYCLPFRCFCASGADCVGEVNQERLRAITRRGRRSRYALMSDPPAKIFAADPPLRTRSMIDI